MRKRLREITYYLLAAIVALSPNLLLAENVNALTSPGILTKVSVGTYAGYALYAGQLSAVSGDGRYVVFVGSAGSYQQLFIRDTAIGTTELVSSSSSGVRAGESINAQPSVSYDGRYVAFYSGASNLVPNDNNGVSDVFVKDRLTGAIQRVNVGHDGTEATGGASGPVSISSDGRFVAFGSAANNIVPNDTNNASDAFRRDMHTGETIRISVSSSGAQTVCASSYCGAPTSGISGPDSITPDGRYILFSSKAGNLSPLYNGSGGSANNAYVRDTVANTTTMVNVTYDNRQSLYGGYASGISDDGRYIAFSCGAGAISTGCQMTSASDTASTAQVYLRDMQTGTNSRVSVTPSGSQGNANSGGFTISRDGTKVLFTSNASDLVPNDTNGRLDIFVRDLIANTTSRISVTGTGEELNGTIANPRMSPDGKYISFTSSANNLVPGDSGGTNDIFLLNRFPDSASPVVTGVPDRDPNTEGWYNADVTIDWQSVDPTPSSGTPTDPSDTLASLEGANTYTSNSSCDPAGNCATGNLTLSIDKTAPTLSTPSWSQNPILPNESTTFTVDGSDAHSGIMRGEYYIDNDPGVGSATALDISANTLSGSIASGLSFGAHAIGIRAQDKAGNWSSVATSILTVEDRTPPEVNYALSGSTPNTAGWYRQPVSLAWSYDDLESAITDVFGCEPLTINSDTTSVSPSCKVTSAGGTSTETVTVKYDATAPTLGTPTWSSNPLPFGQTTTLSVPATDATSGIYGGEYYLGADPGVGNAAPLNVSNGTVATNSIGSDLSPGVYNVGIRAQDIAGNWSTALTTYLVVYDPNGPGYLVGHQNITPTSSDILPWISSQPGDFATFGFNVKYASGGSVDPSSKFSFRYVEKGSCGTPNAAPCHSFILNANMFDWLSIGGTNYSQGAFQGTASLSIDGVASNVKYRVDAIDGSKLDVSTTNSFILKVYALGANMQTEAPIYRVTADFTPGNGNATGGVQIKQ